MNAKHDVPGAVIGNVVRSLLEGDARKVTAFLSPKLTVKASRVMFDGKIGKRDRRADIVLTIGEPNYAERRYIKLLQKVGEPFPVRKFQIKMPPAKNA